MDNRLGKNRDHVSSPESFKTLLSIDSTNNSCIFEILFTSQIGVSMLALENINDPTKGKSTDE